MRPLLTVGIGEKVLDESGQLCRLVVVQHVAGVPDVAQPEKVASLIEEFLADPTGNQASQASPAPIEM